MQHNKQMQEEVPYQDINLPYQRQNSLAKSQVLNQPKQPQKHIHFTFPKKQQVQLRKMAQPEKEKEDSIFNIFKCCTEAEIEPEYEHTSLRNRKQASKVSLRSNEPYISVIRMKNRQSQPISMFNDHLVSEKLTKSRWYVE